MDKHNVFLDDNLKLVRIVARGELTKSLGRQIITEARNLAVASKVGLSFRVFQDESDALDWMK